jgi:phosphoglycolate phosphatase-like HAD superfamily hydrolase
MCNKASEYVERSFSKADAQEFHKEMGKFLRQYEADATKKSKLFPEAISTPEEIRRRGAKTGLVTNTSREAVEIVFEMHALERHFDVVVACEDVKKPKPDSEGVLEAIRRLGAKDFFIVGDLVLYVLATKNANGTSIFIRRGGEDGILVHTDYLVHSLEEVPSVIKTLKNES